MSLTTIGGQPLIAIGHAGRQGNQTLATLSGTTCDAAKEAHMAIGHLVWEDFGSHTIDTTGSSSIGWRTNAVTFANAGTTLVVGLAAVDSTTGPPQRAVNITDTITFDVSVSYTGGGATPSTTAWQESVPTSGTKTIASGDLIAAAVQMTARAGADSVVVGAIASAVAPSRPNVANFVGGSYSNANFLPNFVITASDGTLGFFIGGFVASVGLTQQTWNNTSGTKEYGNVLQFPFPVTVYGIVAGCDFAGDTDLILYSDPLGTPVAQRTVSVDLNQIANNNAASNGTFYFSSPIDLLALTNYGVIAKPTSATTIGLNYKTFNAAAHQKSELLGTNCYAINRNTGAFASQNSNKDRFAIGLLVGGAGAGRVMLVNNASVVA